MPDIETPADTGQDQSGGEKNSATGADNDQSKEGGDSQDADKGKQDVKPPEEDAEPTTRQRMSPKDFIIQRQQKKIEKLKDKSQHSENADNEEKEDEDEIAPEDEALISKVVAKRFAPLLEKTMADEDSKEISDFLSENPEFKPYEAKARKYISHPSRRHLPISSIFYEVAGKDLMKLGAERGRKADEEARQTQTGGGSGRGGNEGKKIWNMSPQEFAAEQEKVRRSM